MRGFLFDAAAAAKGGRAFNARSKMDMMRRLGAEFFGTFCLTSSGCGSAVLAARFPSLGIALT
jgi:hypothetical protein